MRDLDWIGEVEVDDREFVAAGVGLERGWVGDVEVEVVEKGFFDREVVGEVEILARGA